MGSFKLNKKVFFLLFFLSVYSCCYAQEQKPLDSGTNSPDILDSLISISLILFFLSVIVEKITQLIRKYAPFIKPNSKFRGSELGHELASFWRNINNKQTGKSDELNKKIEREVNSLSFVLGLFIAGAFHVDLFKMIGSTEDPRSLLFWNKETAKLYKDGWDVLLLVISFILTGFFLTFGSKFFHDLLELLFYSKNVKRTLTERGEITDNSLALEFKRGEEDEFKKFLEHQFSKDEEIITYDYEFENGKITLYVDDRTNKKFNNALLYKSRSGDYKRFDVLIQPVDKDSFTSQQQEIFANKEIAHLHLHKGTNCGSLGYIVRDKNTNEELILTCFHVIWNQTYDWHRFALASNNMVVCPISGDPIGEVFFAIRNNEVDATVIKIAPGVTTSKRILLHDEISECRDVDLEDKRQRTKVQIDGKSSGPRDGIIVDINVPARIMYPDGKRWRLEKLIKIKPIDNNPFSKGGDSGSLVVDEFGFAIGLLVAGDEKLKTSFAIPINKIFNQLNLKL